MRRYIVRLELGIAIVVASIGCFFIYLASSIPPALHDPIGPKVLPMFLAIALVVGGGLIALVALGQRRGVDASRDDDELHKGYGFQESHLGRIFAVIGCGFVYVVTFWAFGYFAATFVSVVLIMLAFGNRNWFSILLVALGAAVVYQFLFMGLMGLFDQPGKIADLRPYTNWLSGAQ